MARAKMVEKEAKGIQDELGIWIAKHDELINKYVQIEKERANIKNSATSIMSTKKGKRQP